MSSCRKLLADIGLAWIWKDDKYGFEAFLKALDGQQKKKVVDLDTLAGVEVFSMKATLGSLAIPRALWEEAYHKSSWFGDIYRLYTTESSDLVTTSYTATKALLFRVDSFIEIL